MPPKRNRSKPPEVMTWRKALPVLVVCALFDALRFMFEQFLFFGPALAGIYCTIKVAPVIGTTAGTTVCSSAAVSAGLAGSAAIVLFGVVMAMAVGFAGWIVIGFWLVRTDARVLKQNFGSGLLFVASLAVSEIPIIGSLPALTFAMARLYYVQIKKERVELQKYEEEQMLIQRQEFTEEQDALLMYT